MQMTVIVVALRTCHQSAFNINFERKFKEIKPGDAWWYKDGSYSEEEIDGLLGEKSCRAFERNLFFQEETDPDIYQERIKFGKLLIPSNSERIDFDLKNTVFLRPSPNTA